MEKKEEILYKNKMNLMAFLFFCGGLITGGMVERIDTNRKALEQRQEQVRVEYQGEEYPLWDFYQLVGKNEKHLCLLERDVYYDVTSKEVICIKGYEEIFGYKVTSFLEEIPYEEYGSVTQPDSIQEEFDEITKNGDSPKVKIR